MNPERSLPSRSNNFVAQQNLRRLSAELKARSPKPQVLIVGAGEGGHGTDVLISDPDISVVSSDKHPRNGAQVQADAHDLPFADSSFDGVVIQEVLEHVLDPWRCVSEIHRVLRPGGLVYSETPFMAQVHGGAEDFTRFTFLGQRRLFRKFTEIDSGIAVGAGSAFGWSVENFLVSFTRKRGPIRKLLRAFSRLTTFWAPMLDPWLSQRAASYDAALCFYFIGARSDKELSDDELPALLRTGQ